MAKKVLASACAKHRREQLVSVVDVRHTFVGRAVKSRCRENEDGGVNQEGEQQRAGGVDGGEFDGFAFAFFGLLDRACLDDARMQIEIVRHDRRAQNADGDVQRRWVE